VEVFLPHVKHTLTLKSSPGKVWNAFIVLIPSKKSTIFYSGPDGTGIQIDNEIDIRGFDDREIAMRFSSEIASGNTFFTDLNGFQIIKRKIFDKLPLQGNYYPIPSMAYIKVRK